MDDATGDEAGQEQLTMAEMQLAVQALTGVMQQAEQAIGVLHLRLVEVEKRNKRKTKARKVKR
ncbi:unnamed protein product [marine sediment metagenome]|uniref:Uncharacterized protein n=1 Tax=marine sediment metagenome TaxID=412755 RepID=X0V4N4_9ZZZZ